MRHRLRRWIWLVPWVLAGGCAPVDNTPALTWTGRWQKTDLRGSYGTFIRMEDGRIARFSEVGLPKSVCPSLEFPGGIGFRITREPGDLFTWTPQAPLMTWEAIDDLPDSTDALKPAGNRLMTRATVVRLTDGSFRGLAMICRDQPAVDGLYYLASFAGPAAPVNAASEALLAAREAPLSVMWKYEGKVRGPVGEYQEKVQVPNSMYVEFSNLIVLPDGPAKPDHARPTGNRFLFFASYLGAPEPQKNGWLWTSLCYSADGREWFFAKDTSGAVRNVMPSSESLTFPFVFRHAADEWWMWRSGDWHTGEGTDTPLGVREIYLFYSSDGLNWRQVRRDVTWTDFPGPDGSAQGLKDMRLYYDDKTGQLHGMLSVWDPTVQGWHKYHNLARVTRK